MIDPELYELASECLDLLRHNGQTIATAESCTGGMIGAALTAVPGSSDVVDRGFITYTNAAKSQMLGVPPETIAEVGAVSEKTARAMASGALTRSDATLTVAVTGVAGPGQSEAKPAGLVYIACARIGQEAVVEEHRFEGDRAAVRRATVVAALQLAMRLTRR